MKNKPDTTERDRQLSAIVAKLKRGPKRVCNAYEDDSKRSSDLREAFRRMEQEQQEEYADYVRRCGGVPVSQVKP